jgi:nucleoid-associated protein YgaU
MGLFSFLTEAGSKLGGKIHDVTHNDMDATAQITPGQINDARANSIIANINESGVEVADLAVTVDSDKVSLKGRVSTQACSEKLTLISGNQFGIGSVDCQLEVANPEPEATFYIVKSDDDLSKIAKEFYGNASKYPVIFEANRPMLTNPNKIFVGQSLRIPAN